MWRSVDRPGFFGRKRDEKVAALDQQYGKGLWRLAWVVHGSSDLSYTFFNACRTLYEDSYFHHFVRNPQEVDIACQYVDCYDNAKTNVESGLDYMKQEAFSTHIQDIAVRNCLRRLDRWFTGANGQLLEIRSKDSVGFRFGPGNIPFAYPYYIHQPSLCPSWANKGSVEDFWQSNKFLQVWGQ